MSHKCLFETINYSQVKEGKLNCTYCGRIWTLTWIPNKNQTEEDYEKGKWQWVANPPIVDKVRLAQVASAAKKKAIQKNMAQKRRYTGTTRKVLPHTSVVRKVVNEHRGTSGGTGMEEKAAGASLSE